MEIQSDQDTICYLTLLPTELWNYIVQFLPWETEEELIQRTEIEKNEKFPEDYYQYFPMNKYVGMEHIIGAFSPDKHKIALFNAYCGGCVNPGACGICESPVLVIVDLEKEQEENKIIFSNTLITQYYRTIGLSSSGDMYAAIKKKIKNEEIRTASHRDYQDFLVIHDRIKNRKCNFEIPDDFIVSHLMFNKQGTCVIAHARDYRCDPMQKNYVLFNLKKNIDTKNDIDKELVIEEKKNEKNKLLDYFRHYGVCKMLSDNKK